MGAEGQEGGGRAAPANIQAEGAYHAQLPGKDRKNVLDADGTVIFTHGKLAGGSKLTMEYAQKHGKPCLHIDLNEIPDYNAVFSVRKWMHENGIKVLNVAGSRATKDPQIYDLVYKVIKGIFWTNRIKGKPHIRIVK